MKMTPRLIIIGGLAVVLTVVAFVVFLPAVVFKPAPTVNTCPSPPRNSSAGTCTSPTAACTATASSRAPAT